MVGRANSCYREGDRIVLEGEADQAPGQIPGDIVFILSDIENKTFKRQGADLLAEVSITLGEALCGFSRVVIKHLDGRGIHINHPRGAILKPNQVIKVVGEGMPIKKSELRGDLYFIIKVKFPEDGWLADESITSKLEALLPKPDPPITVETVDEVDYDETAEIEHFGTSEKGQGGAWVDEDDEGPGGQTQCTQQ